MRIYDIAATRYQTKRCYCAICVTSMFYINQIYLDLNVHCYSRADGVHLMDYGIYIWKYIHIMEFLLWKELMMKYRNAAILNSYTIFFLTSVSKVSCRRFLTCRRPVYGHHMHIASTSCGPAVLAVVAAGYACHHRVVRASG